MRMHPAIRQEPHQMQRMSLFFEAHHHLYKSSIRFKTAVSDITADAQEVLVDHPTSAKVQMTNFRVTLLSFRQSDSLTTCLQCCVRAFFQNFFAKERFV